MKKLLLAAGVAATVYGGWQWQTQDDERPKVGVYNRLWIDHFPETEREVFHVFFATTPEGIGQFAQETIWHGEHERFRFSASPGEIRAVFPWTNDHETIKVEAKKCDAEGFDYCLEMSGASRGVKKYYSRKEWGQRGLDEIRAQLLPQSKR